jgi:hypothetical protein
MRITTYHTHTITLSPTHRKKKTDLEVTFAHIAQFVEEVLLHSEREIYQFKIMIETEK